MRTLLRTAVILLAATLALTSDPPKECPETAVRQRTLRIVTGSCNTTTLKDKQLKEIQAPAIILYLPLLYLVAFCVGLPANLLALWVLVSKTTKLPSTILLINLTVLDLTLLTVLPFRIQYHFQGNDWHLGEPLCRIVMAMFYGNMYGSALCLALVAFDRYVALVHPFGARAFRSRKTSLYMSLAVWIVVIASMTPLLLLRQTYKLDEPTITTCHDALPSDLYLMPYFTSLFVLCFLLPLLLILYCYGAVLRTLVANGMCYSHAVRVTVLTLVAFVLCLLPNNVCLLLNYSFGKDLYLPYMLTLASSTFNSCIDPFIYYYVSDDFREKAKNALRCRCDTKRATSSAHCASYSSCSLGQRSKMTLLSDSSDTIEKRHGLKMPSSLHDQKMPLSSQV